MIGLLLAMLEGVTVIGLLLAMLEGVTVIGLLLAMLEEGYSDRTATSNVRGGLQ